MAFITRFLGFWYDFIVGDDWAVAVGVVIALGLTALAVRSDAATIAWVVTPLGAVLATTFSLWRVVRSS